MGTEHQPNELPPPLEAELRKYLTAEVNDAGFSDEGEVVDALLHGARVTLGWVYPRLKAAEDFALVYSWYAEPPTREDQGGDAVARKGLFQLFCRWAMQMDIGFLRREVHPDLTHEDVRSLAAQFDAASRPTVERKGRFDGAKIGNAELKLAGKRLTDEQMREAGITIDRRPRSERGRG